MINCIDISNQYKQLQEKENEYNKTAFFNILEPKLSERIMNIMGSKFANPIITLTNDDTKSLLLAANELQNSLLNNTIMCKILPIDCIKECLSPSFEFSNFMLRKGDIKYLVDQNFDGDIVTTLFRSLRLDYSGNKFETANRMVILEVQVDKFAIRTPLNTCNFTKDSRIILHNDELPYIGVGFTASPHGVPEFYVTIANEKKSYISSKGTGFEIGYGKFPICAFDVDLLVADRKTNKIIHIASYNSETFEGKNLYEKFERCNSNIDSALRKLIISEYQLENLLI